MGWLLTIELYDNAKGISLFKGLITFGYYMSERVGIGFYFSLIGIIVQIFLGRKEVKINLPRNTYEA